MPSQSGRSNVATVTADAVGGHGEEAGLAEVQQAGVAEVHVEADRGEREHHGLHADGRLEGVDDDPGPVHVERSVPQPTRCARPRMPCGRTRRMTIRMPSAPTFFSSTGIHSVDTEMNRPTTMLPTSGAVRRAQPAEGDRGEDEQQDLEAHLEVDALGETEQDAGQPGQHRAGDPDHPDDPVDVDAGGRGQRRVVGDGAGRLADPGALQGDDRGEQDDDRDAPSSR